MSNESNPLSFANELSPKMRRSLQINPINSSQNSNWIGMGDYVGDKSFTCSAFFNTCKWICKKSCIFWILHGSTTAAEHAAAAVQVQYNICFMQCLIFNNEVQEWRKLCRGAAIVLLVKYLNFVWIYLLVELLVQNIIQVSQIFYFCSRLCKRCTGGVWAGMGGNLLVSAFFWPHFEALTLFVS